MTFTWPDLIPDERFVTPHQLCQCCRRLAETIIQICPTRDVDDNDKLVCEHYDSLQDLIDGAKGGCHVCNIMIDTSRDRVDRCPVWLRCHEGIISSDGKMSWKTKVTTGLLARTDATWIALTVDDSYGTSILVYVNFRDPIPADQISCSKAQLSKEVASDAHFGLIQKWIDACTDKEQHPTCNIDGQFRKPTRLLDLSCFDKDVCLINGDDSKGPYAALSYSWGAVLQLKAFRSNLEEFQQRIAIDQLSRVAQDAIHVCRKLSISYLWIDALCIVQGDDGDFSTEAPRMQDVYAGSLLTIVAADSKDTTESFLGHRNPLSWLECTLEGTAPSKARKHFKVEPMEFCRKSRPSQFHIDSRAWCLQERFMSPRSIFFGSKGIHWECRTGLACEADLEVKENHGYVKHNLANQMKSRYAELQSMQSQLRIDNASGVSRVRKMWRELVEAYSRMHLSHLEDGLIAISGIASVFKPLLQSQCTYGMWVCRISEELLWATTHNREDPPSDFLQYLPSWSWIGAYEYGCQIFLPSILRFPRKVDNTYFAEVVSWPSDAGFDTRLLQGPRDTRICVKGHLTPYTETWTGRKYDSKDEWNTHALGSNGVTRREDDWKRVTRFSAHDFDLAETTLFCLLLRCEYEHEVYHNEGLLLTPVDPSERIYRRVGVIEESHPSSEFPDAPPSSFVQGKFLVDLWAPLGGEQEIYIV